MRKAFFLFSLAVAWLGWLAWPAYATSSQAYQDYLYQFDLYRNKYSEFKIAKNEYEKFKSLESQTTALEKTKIMLAQRDELLRAYLFFLNEKLNEDHGLEAREKQLYQTLIRNEATFLDNHRKLVAAIGSLDDAVTVSQAIESHYLTFQTTIRQIIIGVRLGQLTLLANQYDTVLASAKNLVILWRTTFSPQKQATIDRWLLTITNKRSLYQQKIDKVSRTNSGLRSSSLDELDQIMGEQQKNLAEAHQYLIEGTANLRELMNSLRWND
ncbi:MAG: hypothetical protein ACOY0S_04465 [Patescibacteria group bacterium]